MDKKNFYIALGVVFVASMAASFFLPFSETVRVVAAIPGIGSLFGALLQIARDRIAHERSIRILELQNMFSMGATSHMAEIAFDKYSEFCEEYVTEMYKALTTLTREGPHQSALDHANNLVMIQRKWAVWLTPAIEKQLYPFELALRKIGVNAHILADVPGEGRYINEMYKLFSEILGFDTWQGEALTGDLTVTAVIGRLRAVLGTEELSRLREDIVTRALRNLEHAE